MNQNHWIEDIPVIMISSDDDELVNVTSMAECSRVIVMYEGHISAILEGDAITRENISADLCRLKKNKCRHN